MGKLSGRSQLPAIALCRRSALFFAGILLRRTLLIVGFGYPVAAFPAGIPVVRLGIHNLGSCFAMQAVFLGRPVIIDQAGTVCGFPDLSRRADRQQQGQE